MLPTKSWSRKPSAKAVTTLSLDVKASEELTDKQLEEEAEEEVRLSPPQMLTACPHR